MIWLHLNSILGLLMPAVVELMLVIGHCYSHFKTCVDYICVDMIAQVAVGVVIGLLGYAYLAIKPSAPKICGMPVGPPVT